MKNYSHKGDTCGFLVPYAVLAGAGFQVGSFFAVAKSDAANGAAVQGEVVGVFDLTKSTAGSSGATAGTKVYWDNTAKVVTKTASTNMLIGALLKDAADGDATFHVRLNGIAV